jgi:hypothetical protein
MSLAWGIRCLVRQRILTDSTGDIRKAISERICYRSLLGLISGHFDIDALHLDKKTQKAAEDLVTQANSGLAIVTPIK